MNIEHIAIFIATGPASHVVYKKSPLVPWSSCHFTLTGPVITGNIISPLIHQ